MVHSHCPCCLVRKLSRYSKRANSTCFGLIGLQLFRGFHLWWVQNLPLDSFHASTWWKQAVFHLWQLALELDGAGIVGIWMVLSGMKHEGLKMQLLFLSTLGFQLLSWPLST